MPFSAFGVITDAARLDAAFAAGVDYVEPFIVDNVVVPDATRWRLADAYRGRRHPSFAVLVPGSLQLIGTEGSADGRADAARAYFEAVFPILGEVAEPGAKVVFGSGRSRTVPDGVGREAARDQLATIVRIARDAAAASGLRIMLEPLHTGETNLINSIGEAAEFLDAYGIDDVPIVADLFHIMLHGEPLGAILQHASRIGHAHIADSGRRYLGTGDWPWRDFLAMLQQAGYDGSVSLECNWGEDFEAEVRGSVELLRAV
ncbi:TIM barrel protein [Planctomonas sp. JC2975]|uniref:sugar phosphate isomerase/epimerase family protein n=1 Tax=Planctomonas sp. JC2975 TaxID=2729626 RepID=UPI001474E9F7|nr:sugar phosphate isomerase/epimerase family protein [Planctomonas sp. JC2975]NNC13615.1 TIM barrel protein [Planctomonas sp. JC2975]